MSLIKPGEKSNERWPVMRWPYRILAITATVVAGIFILTISSFAVSEAVKDENISNAIEAEYWTSPEVDANNVTVATNDGIVTLTGVVNNLLAKEHARMIAEGTVGVRAVVNQVKVLPGVSRTDDEVSQAVTQALLKDPATDSYEVNVSTKNGIVSLSGTVNSWQEKQLCSKVAKSVRGARGIENNIVVDFTLNRSDFEIKPEIEHRLANDVMVDDYLIDVEVKDGKAKLSGTVGSVAEKNRAISDAWVGGVKKVDGSKLEIKWWARENLRRKSIYVDRTDAEIERAVKDAFLYDPRVVSFNPVVMVDDGTVTLTGVVDNLLAKRAAEMDARNTIGVRRVKNHLKVQPENTIGPDELEQKVSNALLENPYVSGFDVKVDAFDKGWIKLSGRVNNSFEKGMAEHVATSVKGVTGIFNNLKYDYEWQWKPDWVIKEDVEDQLFWNPFVDENKVMVDVDRGIVTLNGNVETWTERLEAGKNAWEAGAKDVRNRLTVTYQFYGPRPDKLKYDMPYDFIGTYQPLGFVD